MSGGCHDGSFDRGPATSAHAGDDIEPDALSALRSAPFDRPEPGRITIRAVTATGMEMTATRYVKGVMQ